MALRFVALDLNNVLCDLFPNAFAQVMAQHAGLSAALARARFPEDVWHALERGDLEPAEFRQRIQQRLGITMPDETFDAAWNLIPIARAGADALVARLTLPYAIWSNTDAIHTRHLTATLACLGGAVHLHLSHLARARKPDAAYYRAGLAALGARPEEVLFIDDRPDNREAAAALGIHVEAALTLPEVEAALQRHNVLGPALS